MYAGGKRAGGGGGEGGTGAQQPFCPLEWLSALTFRALPFFFFFYPRVLGIRREDLGSSWPFRFQMELDYSAALGLHINHILHDMLIHTRPGRSAKKTEEEKRRREEFLCSTTKFQMQRRDWSKAEWASSRHMFLCFFDWLEMAAGFCRAHVGKE